MQTDSAADRNIMVLQRLKRKYKIIFHNRQQTLVSTQCVLFVEHQNQVGAERVNALRVLAS